MSDQDQEQQDPLNHLDSSLRDYLNNKFGKLGNFGSLCSQLIAAGLTDFDIIEESFPITQPDKAPQGTFERAPAV